jgi:hypothetical protein
MIPVALTALVLIGVSTIGGSAAARVADQTAAVEATVPPTPESGQFSSFCVAGPAVEAALSTSEPDPAILEAALVSAESAAPAELADAIATVGGTVRDILASGDVLLYFGADNLDALGNIYAYYVAKCGFGEIALTATDYGFDGAPESVPVGPVVVALTNNGVEIHEAFVLRVADDAIGTVIEIVTKDEAVVGPGSPLEPIGSAIAFPGGAGYAALTLEQPGRYAIVCYVPEGAATFDVLETLGGAAPHYTLGMVAEFEVTATATVISTTTEN